MSRRQTAAVVVLAILAAWAPALWAVAGRHEAEARIAKLEEQIRIERNTREGSALLSLILDRDRM